MGLNAVNGEEPGTPGIRERSERREYVRVQAGRSAHARVRMACGRTRMRIGGSTMWFANWPVASRRLQTREENLSSCASCSRLSLVSALPDWRQQLREIQTARLRRRS